MAIMGGAVARESLTVRAWGATCVYVIIYGVAFVFLVGPATSALAGLGNAADRRFMSFTMWLVTAAVLTVGAALWSYTLDLLLDRHYLRHAAPAWRVELAFAVRGVLFSILSAGLFVGLGAFALGGVSYPLLWAAVLAFIVPGVVAGASTHMVTPTVLTDKKQLVTVSGCALVVVGLSNYVLLGAGEPLGMALGV